MGRTAGLEMLGGYNNTLIQGYEAGYTITQEIPISFGLFALKTMVQMLVV